jgi:hypothetical protein
MTRILLDECLPRRFGALLQAHEVRTVAQMRWAGLRNGRLLERAEHEFDALITVDRSMRFQQHVGRFNIALVVLRSRSNRYPDIAPLAPEVLSVIGTLMPGSTTFVRAEPPEPA